LRRSFCANFLGIEPIMGILRVPGRIYDYLYNGFGWFGLAVAALLLVLAIVSIMVWFDRRR
jgi:hypothetical protein